MTQNRAWCGATIAFLITVGAGAAFIKVVEQRRAEARKSSAVQVGAARGRLLESRLNAALSRAEALALVLTHNQTGAPLDSIVAELARSSGSILGLQLAPGGIVDRTDSSEASRSEEHTSELQSPYDLVCRLLLE